jgi:nucleoid-associated protein YgaU
VEISTKKATISAPVSRTDNSSSGGQTYTVVKGDCLWNISKKFYGSGAKYTIIYNANKSVIGGNPNLIYPGQVLTIPAA